MAFKNFLRAGIKDSGNLRGRGSFMISLQIHPICRGLFSTIMLMLQVSIFLFVVSTKFVKNESDKKMAFIYRL